MGVPDAEIDFYWVMLDWWRHSTNLAAAYYDAPISQINLLCAIGPLFFLPFSVIFTWSIERYGIRKNVIIAAILVASGGVVRAIPNGGYRLFPLVALGQILNSIAGPAVMVLPTKLSATWFAPSERTFSTAVLSLANFSGSAIGFLLALYSTDGEKLKLLLYAEAISAGIILLAAFIYFPERPPSPPTAILTIACGLTSGTYAGWSTVLTRMIAPTIFSDSDAKWMGFYGILAGLAGGIMWDLSNSSTEVSKCFNLEAFKTLVKHKENVKFLERIPGGFCSASNDENLFLWREDGEFEREIARIQNDYLNGILCVNNNYILTAGSTSPFLVAYKLGSVEVPKSLSGHNGCVNCLVNLSATHFVTGSAPSDVDAKGTLKKSVDSPKLKGKIMDKTIIIWSAEDFTQVASISREASVSYLYPISENYVLAAIFKGFAIYDITGTLMLEYVPEELVGKYKNYVMVDFRYDIINVELEHQRIGEPTEKKNYTTKANIHRRHESTFKLHTMSDSTRR
eukprot:gene15757-18724_t